MNTPRSHVSPLLAPLMAALVGSMALLACAPNTIIRRTALINAPQAPTREGQALDKGQVRVQAHVSGVNTSEHGSFFFFEPGVAEVGDPGVLIPDFHLGGSVWAGLPHGLEFGGQLYYASMGWADPNVFGVLPFPEGQEEDLLMGGLGLRLNIEAGNPRLALAMMADINLASIPEAIFKCVDELACTGQMLATDAAYRFERVDHETFFLPNLALQFGWRLGDLPAAKGDETFEPNPTNEAGQADLGSDRMTVMPYLLVGLQSSITNTGFEPDPATLPEDSLEALWMGYVGFGVDANLAGFILGASLILPIEGEDAIDFGVSMSFRVGAQFD